VSKKCIKCGEEKKVSEFHKHKRMADGHLNMCKKCQYEYAKKYRSDRPNLRKDEYAKLALKTGVMKFSEYMKKRTENKMGRKYSTSMYAHKRRMQVDKYDQTEFDKFVFCEALKLRDLRNKTTLIKWNIDHIVPLNHRHACGLHNAFNLQVVPASWNFKKSNTNMKTFFMIITGV